MTLAPAPIGIVPRLHVFLSYRNPEARFADVLKEHLIQDFIGYSRGFSRIRYHKRSCWIALAGRDRQGSAAGPAPDYHLQQLFDVSPLDQL